MTDDSPITVRVATPADLEEIMKLAVEAAKENGFLEASHTLLLKAIWGPINQDHGIIGCIGAPGAKVEGMIVLSIGKIFYSDTECIEERTVYVRPEYRSAKGGRAKKLVEFGKSVADSIDLPLLIGVLSHERTKAKCKLYERMFGPPAGNYWIYKARTGNHEVVA
jgi:N-acetylglutamate synthase-like GNAT family acetyltransferase